MFLVSNFVGHILEVFHIFQESDNFRTSPPISTSNNFACCSALLALSTFLSGIELLLCFACYVFNKNNLSFHSLSESNKANLFFILIFIHSSVTHVNLYEVVRDWMWARINSFFFLFQTKKTFKLYFSFLIVSHRFFSFVFVHVVNYQSTFLIYQLFFRQHTK